MSERVRIYCPDYPRPSGGVRQLYRMADLLNAMGHRATIIHRQPGFAIHWFEHSTPVEPEPAVRAGPGDWAVIPEDSAFYLGQRLRGARKVIYNQNAYLTFQGATLAASGSHYCPYFDPEVRATIAISEDTEAYLRHAFPAAAVFRHRLGCDPEGIFRFVPQERKRRRLAYMPRKNAGDAMQVLQILRARGVLPGWEVQTIDQMPPSQVAGAMGESALFLSFGHPEGFSLPPAEAMLCGCVVVGYHGNGGREYLTAERGYPVEVGQIVGFARAAESVMSRWVERPTAFSEMCAAAREFIRATYSAEAESASMEQIWSRIFAGG